jgi:hypothetical protein
MLEAWVVDYYKATVFAIDVHRMSSRQGDWGELRAAKTKDRSETGGAHDRNYNEPVLNEVEYNTLLPVVSGSTDLQLLDERRYTHKADRGREEKQDRIRESSEAEIG